MERFVKVACLVLITSCVASLKHEIRSEKTLQNAHGRFDPKNKFVRVNVLIDHARPELSGKYHILRLKNAVTPWFVHELQTWGVFDSVHESPSEVKEILHPKAFDDDYSVTVSIRQSILKKRDKNFLRIVSFGGVGQEQVRSISYDITIENRKTAQKLSFKKDFQVKVEGRIFVVLYPFDAFTYIDMAGEEAEMLLLLVKKDLRNAFNIDEKNDA